MEKNAALSIVGTLAETTKNIWEGFINEEKDFAHDKKQYKPKNLSNLLLSLFNAEICKMVKDLPKYQKDLSKNRQARV